MSGKGKSQGKQVVAQNRKARHDYTIEETYEAGIVLQGSEVKSLRNGKANITDNYVGMDGEELMLFNAHIPEYTEANRMNHYPKRPRKLLMHRREINKLIGQIKTKGKTMVALSIYFNQKNFAKVEVALVSGKKQHDKRAAEKEKDWKRDKARLLKGS